MPNDSSYEDSSYEYSSSDSNGGTGSGKASINAEATYPFLAAIEPNASSVISYSSLKAARVSALMFFGGELYDAGHSRKMVYMNPSLPTLVNDCTKVGMPYGIYVNVRARSAIEADEECRALYYILAHYPPILGIWLAIKTTNSKSMNDEIIEVYYKYIDKWGLGQRCGLYLDKYQLSNITWTTFQDRFYLWLISPMDVSEIDDELLDPVMFEVN